MTTIYRVESMGRLNTEAPDDSGGPNHCHWLVDVQILRRFAASVLAAPPGDGDILLKMDLNQWRTVKP